MGGRLHPEWWQVCPGISGRVGPEYALTDREAGIRSNFGQIEVKSAFGDWTKI